VVFGTDTTNASDTTIHFQCLFSEPSLIAGSLQVGLGLPKTNLWGFWSSFTGWTCSPCCRADYETRV